MEDQEVIAGVRDVGCVSSSNEETAQQVSSGKERENLNVDLLEDLDSYLDDINDRLMISRMVSNSVIKGMVKAVEQAAEKKIAAKELQVDSLQEKLHSFGDLTRKYLDENKNRASLELRALEREEELRLAIEENKRLEQKVHLLVGSLEKNEKARIELSVALVKEKEKFQLASQKVNNLEEQRSLLENLVTERSMEVDSIKGKLALVLKKIELDQGKINKLDQNVELMKKELRETGEHNNMLLAVTEDRQNRILMLEAKEDEQKKQMRSVIILVHEFSRGLSELECQVAERVRNNNLRLEESSSVLSSLAWKMNSLKNTVLLNKKRLRRRCNDLQMAEAEVDLLGDEVDALLSLLEKIYIALDHYSPIFQHYPGVMETLKLVRRELFRESTKFI